MKLILGAINGDYLRNIVLNAGEKTEEVWAAVAYATDETLLFNWCLENKFHLRFYGRLDQDVAVSIPILELFLKRKSENFKCYLVQHHHAKVIWWRGFGLYIGSANLTDRAWNKNIEAGCFFPEEEISAEMGADINDLFDMLHANATPLTDEVMSEMQRQSKLIDSRTIDSTKFWNNPSLKKWSGLVTVKSTKSVDRRRQQFLEEWYSTLQQLRNIGEQVSLPENRPKWVGDSSPSGAQADQFLHAHYYQRTFDGRNAQYPIHFEKNKNRQVAALADAIAWWRELSVAPTSEDVMLSTTAPFLHNSLTESALGELTEQTFREICIEVHSIRDYARRVPNRSVNLPDDGTRYTISQKVDALASKIWSYRTAKGMRIGEVLSYVLYGGPSEQLPERLWGAIVNPDWKIEGLGVSALGEMVGWAMPEKFPPRNGRTSKALRSLGYDVKVHVG